MRLITVAIHTYDHACRLRHKLEREGIEVVLQNVNLESPVVSSGVRVRIHEHNLPLALRIIRSEETRLNSRTPMYFRKTKARATAMCVRFWYLLTSVRIRSMPPEWR